MGRSLIALLLAGLLAGMSAHTETRQAQFVVQATVPARASLEAIDPPSRLTVSPEDLARGYKDVSASYLVDTNSQRGWLLRLSPRLGITRQVEVRGLPGTIVLEDEGVEVYRPRTAPVERLELEYRFVFAPHAAPGSYDLPVHVAAALP